MSEDAEENGYTKVKTCSVFHQLLTDILALPGTVEAYYDIDLASKMGGTVEWIGHDEGDRVRKGDKLLQVDVKVIQAQVERANSAYELAHLKFERTKNLFTKQVVSPDDYDNAQADLRSASAALAESEALLANGSLFSPIDGILDRRMADCGEHIAEGQTVMKIVAIDKVKVTYNVPEKDIHHFQPGNQVNLHVSNGSVHECTGTIEFVAMSADTAARTYPLKVVVDNEKQLLRPGMIVRAELVRRQIEAGIAVPFFTILEREIGKSVFVVEDGAAVERPIEYGMYQNGMVEIVKGLAVGDRLVVVGQRNLVNGQKVSVSRDLTEEAKAYVTSGADLSALVLQ
jgi:membrane fusion protein (multidrug efflux system)